MKKTGSIFLFLVFGGAVVFGQVQPDPRVLVKQAGAVTDDLLQWDGAKWTPGRADVAVVADSAAFRAFNVAISPKLIVMTDSLRGGKFRRCYSCTADQYMTFSDALSRKWERFNTDGKYNAKWFGAKGTGLTDDRWYLQFLSDYINSKGGGTLYMPKGTYNVSKKTSTGTGLSLWNNTTLEGDGWQTVFNYTETFASASSAAIGSRSGNADRSQVQQDSGNVNISIRNLKINFTTKVNRRGNGITLGGTVGGKIERVWVNGSGGYSIHVVKNNDTALSEGKRSEDIGISNCLITEFGDTGIEFSGTNNCTAANCEISGPGLISDIGSAVIVWNGSTNTTISNITVKATANAVSSGIVGVWIQPSYNPLGTPNYKQTNKTVVSNVIAENCHYGIVIGTDEAGPIWGKSKNTIVSNCVFTGNPLYGIGIQVNNADTILMSNTRFSDFSRNIDVSSTQTFSNQRNVNNLSIKDCIFWGGLTPGFNAITGVNDLEFSGNTIENTPSTGITFRGIRGATVNDNIFKNIGTSGNVSATVFTTGNGTNTRETKHLTANNNRLVDDRATKTTFFCIQLAGGTDSCIVMGNDARGGKSGAIAYTNAGTGTSIKFKDTYTGEPYNSDINSDAIANAVLTTNGSGVGLWLLRTSLFTASNGVRAVGSDFQLGSSSTAVGPGDYTGNIFHNLRGFNSTWNTSVGTGLFINGSTADIGVRISNPLASFHIGGGGNFRMNDGFKFSTDGGNNAELSSPGSIYFYAGIPIGTNPSGTAEFNVVDGLVGIRTSSPTQHLDVNGSIRVSGGFYDSANSQGSAGQILSSGGGNTTAWIPAPNDGNGIYGGSGTVPNNTTAALTDDFTISGNDATGTQSAKFRVVATGTDPGVQTWRVGADSVEMVFLSGEPTLRAAGTSGNDFWITGGANDLRLNGLSVQTHAVKNVLGGYLAVPYVSTSANLTVSEGTAEVDVVGTSGTITLTFDNTSNLFGSAAKTITVWNRGAFNVTLSRGAQAWEWSDMTGTNTASNQTLAAGETAKMLWVDAGVTDYYVLHKMPATFTGSPANLAISGTSSPLTVTNSNGTGFTVTAGTNVTLSGTSGNVTINATTQQAYTTVQEEGSSLTQRNLLNFVGSTATAADNTTKTDVTFDSDVNALASTATTGLYSVTGAGTSATRTITAPAAGITVSNGNGVSGNPTLALANDLSAVEGLASNGVAVRTGTDTWTVRTLTAGTGISISNGDGVSGNPTISSTAGGEVVISPSQLTAHTNDWNPTDLATATTIRISGDASFRMITGITAPSAAKQLKIINVGSNSLAFIKENTGSTAANRFTLDKDVVLLPGQVMSLYYDLTSTRWRLDHVTIPTVSLRNRSILFTPASATSSDLEQFAFASGSGGANSFVIPSSTVDAGAPALSISTGTSTTGVGYLSTKSLSAIVPNPTAGCTYFGALIYIPTASDGTNTFVVEAGLKASVTGGTGVNGYFFRYTHSDNSGFWENYVTISGTPTSSSGSVAGVSGAFVLLEIMKRPDGTASYYIDGIRRVTVGAGPTQDLLPVVQIIKSAGTTDRAIQIRYVTTDLYIK